MAIPPVSKEQVRINRDRTCDKIPLVSTATNLIDLFQKIHYRNRPEAALGEVKYSAYIQKKSAGRCILLMIPIIGNIIIAICEHRQAKKAEELLKAAVALDPSKNERMTDPALMKRNLEEAAKLGNEDAKLQLEKLNKPVEPKAEVNDADALYEEGKKLYEEGKFKEAFACFEKAGKGETSELSGNRYRSKHEKASYMLGVMYAKGLGVPYNGAITHQIAQAIGNQPYGKYLMGFILEHGIRVKRNYEQAKAKYQAAANEGVVEAQADADRIAKALNKRKQNAVN